MIRTPNFADRLVRMLRGAPDFLIVGAQKGGTTSLYHYLRQHPQILPARKELHYFDHYYGEPLRWYYSKFPRRPKRWLARLRAGANVRSGEATPEYLVHPFAAERIARAAPAVKLIVLLRNPAERAYSHYRHNRRMGWEPLSFEDAIDREEERIAPVCAAMRVDPMLVDTRFPAYSYKMRGRYLEQLQRYEQWFPREQMLILRSEDLFEEPVVVYDAVLEFLGLQPFLPRDLQVANRGDYEGAFPRKVEELKHYFRPYNDNLFRYLGRSFSWD